MSSYFLTDFLYTFLFFVISCAVVVVAKAVYLAVKEKYFTEQEQEVEQPKPRKKRSRNPTPKPVRSIEIDPEQVERIYVKKSS